MNDQAYIDQLVSQFFQVFDNRQGKKVNLDSLFDYLLPEAVIVKTGEALPQVDNLNSFIEPRKALLNNGQLTEFSETEVSHETAIFGQIAHRFCLYKKSGFLDGQWFETYGKKSLQFVKINQCWKISGVVWDDEREGLEINASEKISA